MDTYNVALWNLFILDLRTEDKPRSLLSNVSNPLPVISLH